MLLLLMLTLALKGWGQIQTGVWRTPTSNGDYHHFTRSGGGAAVYINQVSSSSTHPIMRLSSGTVTANQNVRFTVENNGDVGIGTTTPGERLEVNGNILLSPYKKLIQKNGTSVYSEFFIAGNGQGAGWMVNAQYSGSGNPQGNAVYTVNPGTYSTTAGYLDFDGNGRRWSFFLSNPSSGVGNAVAFKEVAYFDTQGIAFSPTGNGLDFYIKPDGNIGIGTTTPSEKLSVNGTIRSKEVKVEANNWPDYVFSDDYELKSLEETEAYIKEHQHLPDMPSAEEVAENGVALGEMNRLLLEKVEELTLHLIEKNGEIKLMKNELHSLSGQVKTLQGKIDLLISK